MKRIFGDSIWLEGLSVWSLLRQMEDNTRRSPLIIKAWELLQCSITLRHHFLSEWQVMFLGCQRELISPCCTEHVYTRFSLAILNLLYLLLVRKEMKIQSIRVENIASTKRLKEEDMFINFISISFTTCLDSWSFYELLFETCKRWLSWH